MNLNYWENYYKANHEPFPPSSFSQFILRYINEDESIIDLGCGNGRDSLFFKKFLYVVGMDQCSDQIFRLKKHEDHRCKFIVDDFVNIKTPLPRMDHAYSRFTLHAITEAAENHVLNWVFENRFKYFFIEARSDKEEITGVVSDHYRRFININKILLKLLNIGFDIEYAEVAKGFSKYQTVYQKNYIDDPTLIRIVAKLGDSKKVD